VNNEKVNEALLACEQVILNTVLGRTLRADRFEPKRWVDTPETIAEGIGPTRIPRLRHLRWMIWEALGWPAERIEKKFRWLGFIQGALWAEEDATIEALKEMNKP
jgi:hypothetical protein